MDLSTDADFLSGALQLVTGVSIVSQGKDGGAAAGSFDLDCLHKRSLQWTGGDITPAPAPTNSASKKRITVHKLSTISGRQFGF